MISDHSFSQKENLRQGRFQSFGQGAQGVPIFTGGANH